MRIVSRYNTLFSESYGQFTVSKRLCGPAPRRDSTTVFENGTLIPGPSSIPERPILSTVTTECLEPKRIACVLLGLRQRPDFPAQSATSLALKESLEIPS